MNIHRARSNAKSWLDELLAMIELAVERTDAEEIDWYVINDLLDIDILLLIVLSDIDLTINFHELILNQAVRYVMDFNHEIQH